jgi:hypothetical protein
MALFRLIRFGVTDFEFQLAMMRIKKINHLRMQIAEKCGKIYANPQPAATKNLTIDSTRSNHLDGFKSPTLFAHVCITAFGSWGIPFYSLTE